MLAVCLPHRTTFSLSLSSYVFNAWFIVHRFPSLIYKLHTILSEGMKATSLSYLNEISMKNYRMIATLTQTPNKQETVSAPTPLWLNTLALSFSHSLVASASFSPSRLPTSDLSTPTALPTMKRGRGVARDKEEGRWRERGMVGESEGGGRESEAIDL